MFSYMEVYSLQSWQPPDWLNGLAPFRDLSTVKKLLFPLSPFSYVSASSWDVGTGAGVLAF